MKNPNIAFCRRVLSKTLKSVKEFDESIDLSKAWVWHFNGDSWEFHGPDNFYFCMRADNAYHARVHGWSAWLTSKRQYIPADDYKVVNKWRQKR